MCIRDRSKSTASYHFQVGDFEYVSLSDGSLDYPPENFFANVPIEYIKQALRQRNLPTDCITTPYTYLYVDTGQHRVLVDMGAGDLGPRTGQLLQNMQAASIDPMEIDTVLITHAHPEHIGGVLDDKEEWDFQFSEEVFMMVAIKCLGCRIEFGTQLNFNYSTSTTVCHLVVEGKQIRLVQVLDQPIEGNARLATRLDANSTQGLKPSAAF
jgi:ribonuclease BN (tRNA processing enzyme)